MKKIILFLFLYSMSFTDSFESYKKIESQQYGQYKKTMEEEFDSYKKIIAKKWSEPEIFSKKTWVEYSDDYNEKIVIDYEKKIIKTEIIVDIDKNPKDIKKELYSNVKKILSRTTEEATDTFPIEKLKKGINKKNETLVGDIYDIEKNPKNLTKKSKRLVETNEIQYSKAKEINKKVVSIEIPFPKNGLSKKAEKYSQVVYTNSKKKSLPSSLIYSIIECESSFNPMAISPVPAYGLMQVVPTSAGRDISKRIEGKERIFSPKELYDGDKNIEYGSTYLNILYYSYLKSIEDETSRLYCTIAAYNTGAGNIAKTFTGKTNIKNASKIINKLSSEEVYEKLIKNLPYKETRKYLKKVKKTMEIYK